MDDSERLAESYLRSLGYRDVVYEPDGNIPPDFLVDQRIAVEVRRLNQNTTLPTGDFNGLEELFVPLWQRMKRYLPTLGPSLDGESWYVSIRVRRPLEPWHALEPKIRTELHNFMHSSVRIPTAVRITRHLELDFVRAGRPYHSFFLLGMGIDKDSGGFVLAEVLRNLKLCIAEKELKFAPFLSKYPEWWLVLSDHIGHSLDTEDRHQFRELSPISHSWDKVVLLNPLKPTQAFEI